MSTDFDPQLRRARATIVASLAAVLLTSFTLPALGLFYEPAAWRVVLGAVGILLFVTTQTGALYTVMATSLNATVRRRWLWAFAAAAVLSVPLVAPVGDDRWATWAWVGGSIAGSLPLLLRLRPALLMIVVVFGASALVADLSGSSVGKYLLITASVGLTIAAMGGLPAWLWTLLVAAQQGRDAQGKLAAIEERLRFARDVHDLLGHSLSVIALKAELAERLAAGDPARASKEAAEVRRLAASALDEVREAVHGYRTVDLRDHATAVAQVLRSSGIRCTVTVPTSQLPGEVARLFVPVLREASTNVLRHSKAQWCTIDIVEDGTKVRMTVSNDGAGAARPDRHSHGLRGLGDRLADAGGTLRTSEEDGVFNLEVTAPVHA